LGFEGGQTPLYRRLPKRGFSRPNKKEFETLGLNKIEDYVTMGRLSVEGTGEDGFITMKDLVDAKVLTSVKHGVKLVVNDKIGRERKTGPSDTYTCKYPLKLEVSRVSQQAIKAIESSGGSVVATHFNRLALRALLKPHKFEDGMLPRRARPPPKMIGKGGGAGARRELRAGAKGEQRAGAKRQQLSIGNLELVAKRLALFSWHCSLPTLLTYRRSFFSSNCPLARRRVLHPIREEGVP
jgi:ribosomal protein L15